MFSLNKKTIIYFVLFFSFFLFGFVNLSFALSPTPDLTTTPEATVSLEATAQAEPKEKIPPLTESTEEVKGRLESILESQQLGPLGVTNFLQYAIRKAVSQNIPPNTIVLIFLLPVIATLITVFRYVAGSVGFGVFTPVMISVAFIATGLGPGLVLFLVVLLIANLARLILKKIRVHFLPRMSLLLWLICLGVFVLLFLGPQLGFESVADISIFPILIVILLVENFIEVLIGKSRREAWQMTWQTLLVAILGYFLLDWQFLQSFVLLNPEVVLFLVLLVNIFIGRYSGLRLLEYRRFRSLVK